MNGPRRPKLALAIKVQSTSDTKDGAGNECILSPECLLTFELCCWSEEWLLVLVEHTVTGTPLLSYFDSLYLEQYWEYKQFA